MSFWRFCTLFSWWVGLFICGVSLAAMVNEWSNKLLRLGDAGLLAVGVTFVVFGIFLIGEHKNE